ncbi:uncharacterized protein LOC129738834 isoform X2 [Uranotaenia lowii]|nr:uncharacterized protein LOC129738834 isoform X2 [Uranotaenia lowii]XP_055586115.1 uncharacterized protein LOC129738834 isoform X2 [Uranotaenia lowii]
MLLPLISSPWKLGLVIFLLVASCTQANIDHPSAKYSKKTLSRHTRALGFFQKVATMGRLLYQQYNDTTWTLQNVYDILSNEFTDTYTTTTPNPRLPTTTVDPSTSTTPKYRISRAELGRILNRNYRGLQKLFRLEWNEAWNNTKYNIEAYRRELKNPVNATTAKP